MKENQFQLIALETPLKAAERVASAAARDQHSS